MTGCRGACHRGAVLGPSARCNVAMCGLLMAERSQPWVGRGAARPVTTAQGSYAAPFPAAVDACRSAPRETPAHNDRVCCSRPRRLGNGVGIAAGRGRRQASIGGRSVCVQRSEPIAEAVYVGRGPEVIRCVAADAPAARGAGAAARSGVLALPGCVCPHGRRPGRSVGRLARWGRASPRSHRTRAHMSSA